MDERKFHIAGLIGFMVSGALFLAVGLRSGDALTALGSAIWLCSCIVWLLPLIVRRK
jgi:uncharacterized membrane protein YhhN